MPDDASSHRQVLNYEVKKDNMSDTVSLVSYSETHERNRRFRYWMNYCAKISPTGDTVNGKKHVNALDPSNMYFRKLIERDNGFITDIQTGKSAWITIDGYIGATLKSQEEIEHRKRLDFDLDLMRRRRRRLSAYFHADLDTFCKFAEQMGRNIVEFEHFCQKPFVVKINTISSKKKQSPK